MFDRDQLVCIGRVRGTHGLKGCLCAVPLTPYPDYYLQLSSLIIDTGEFLQTFEIQHIRLYNDQWYLQLKDLDTLEQAEKLKGQELLLPSEHLKPLAENEYLCHDLIGCQVINPAGCIIGYVKGLHSSAHQQVLEISRDKGEPLLAPFTKELFPQVNIKENSLIFHPLPGMEEEEDNKKEK